MIYQLWKSGELDKFMKLGIIRSSIPEYCKIYDEYITHRNNGHGYVEAVHMTSEKMNITTTTVKRAIAEVM